LGDTNIHFPVKQGRKTIALLQSFGGLEAKGKLGLTFYVQLLCQQQYPV
jgi:hypothetical protein